MNCRAVSVFAEAESSEVCLASQRISTPSSVCLSTKKKHIHEDKKAQSFIILFYRSPVCLPFFSGEFNQ